jgi:hypothetical protein
MVASATTMLSVDVLAHTSGELGWAGLMLSVRCSMQETVIGTGNPG